MFMGGLYVCKWILDYDVCCDNFVECTSLPWMDNDVFSYNEQTIVHLHVFMEYAMYLTIKHFVLQNIFQNMFAPWWMSTQIVDIIGCITLLFSNWI